MVEAAWPDKAVDVHWAGRTIRGQIVSEHFRPEKNFDLALLRVELADHPCVLLHEAYTLGDEMLAFGYPIGSTTGDPVTLVSEDWQRDQPNLKLKLGQVQPGLSGAPLLNLQTGGVCGVVRLTRDRASDLGGRAIPTALVLEQYDFLVGLQTAFHDRDRTWINLLSMVRAASGGPWWNVPYPRNPNFTGREAILKQLESALACGAPAVLSQAITGLGGVGKTQTAVEYAYRHRQQYRAVLWVRADTETDLASGYRAGQGAGPAREG